jgi:alpha-tubulin suppressor-like RCC1 family protein
MTTIRTFPIVRNARYVATVFFGKRNTTDAARRFSNVGLLLAAMLAWTGCGSPVDLDSEVDTGTSHAALRIDNGLQVNGLQVNGLQVNGLQVNGLQVNGIGRNGLQVNGLQVNGLQLDGLYVNRIGLSGVGFDGIAPNEIGADGRGTSGIVTSGIGLDAVGPDTIGTDGTAIDGRFFDDVSVNGFYLHGVGENGLVIEGVPLRAHALDGLRVGGPHGLRRNGPHGTAPVDLEPARAAVLGVALHHLIACALPAGDSATITSDGQRELYHGLRGFAPEWKTGALSREGEARVRACLESSPVASFGLALNEEQEYNLDILLRYMIECALDASQSVTIFAGDGSPRIYAGAMGLAPEWRDGPLGDGSARKVSACLGARANGLGQTVSISLRHPEIETSEVEADLFTTHEGAFWGNLFGGEATLQACVVDGGGLSGRICAESGSCGFVIQGDCADVCAAYDPINGYSQCGAERTTEVINTFLNLGHRTSFGDGNVCMLGEEHELSCWGANEHGQLADGTTAFRSAPVPVEELGTQVAEAAMGALHACARKRDGSLWCWGFNGSGQLGTGSRVETHSPVQVMNDVATFALGQGHTCAVKTDGSAWCWGSNASGQLGIDRTVKVQALPQVVTGLLSGVARLSSSPVAAHTCAVKDDGSAWCWGRNASGQLGDGSRTDRLAPVQVSRDEQGGAFGAVTDMCTSQSATCARKSDGSLWCWGVGASALPHHLADAVAPGGLSCGAQHACYVDMDARVWCFGANGDGQLGRDTGGAAALTPEQVEGVEAVSFVNAGSTHTCATRVDGALVCWGRDPGQEQPLFPVPLSSRPTEIAF